MNEVFDGQGQGWIGWVVGLVASLVGLIEYIRRRAEREAKRDATQQKILELLKQVLETGDLLDDVLSHPDETKFSIVPALRDHQRIIENQQRFHERLDKVIELLEKRQPPCS